MLMPPAFFSCFYHQIYNKSDVETFSSKCIESIDHEVSCMLYDV